MRSGNNRKTIFLAQPIRCIPQTLLLLLGVVVLAAVTKGYGIESKVIMDVVFIQMRGDHNLEPIAPHFLCQLNTDLMSQLRFHFAYLEALIAVPCDIVIVLTVLLFGQDHLL